MKTLISTVSLAIAAAFVPAAAQTDAPARVEVAPTLAWNRIALETIERAKPSQHQAIRLLTYVSLAQYAALAEAGDGRDAADAVAGASMRVIAGLVPSQAAFVEQRHRESGARPIEAGRMVGDRLLAQAADDGFAQAWGGSLPPAAYVWKSLANPPAAPALPAIGGMRTFLIEGGSVFRSGPPPAPGSEHFQGDIAELRRYTASPTTDSVRIAKFYDMSTGTLAGGFWNEQAAERIAADGMSDREAARVLATMNAAMMDALAACHDTKYVYWVPRPSQADPSIKPLIVVPNHPSYPSNHACLSTAAARVLAHFFQKDRGRIEGMGEEAGLSRIYAGIHYRFDVEAGETIGRSVAEVALVRHSDMLARWTRTLMSGM